MSCSNEVQQQRGDIDIISHKKSLCSALTDRVISHTVHSGGRSHVHLRLLWDMLGQNGSSDATEAPMERQLYLTLHLFSVHTLGSYKPVCPP